MKLFKYIIIPIFILLISINTVFAKTLTVKSSRQEYNDSKKLITLTDKVNVKIDDVTVKSPKAYLNITPGGKPDTATFTNGAQAIQITKDSKSETKANILKLSLITKEVEATGNVFSKMERLGKPTVTIKSDYQSFNTNTNLMEAKKNVTMTYDDIKTVSDSAKIWIAKTGGLDFVKIIGNAKVTQEQVEIKGETVSLDAKKEIMTAEGSAYTVVKVDEDTTVKIWAQNQQYHNKSNMAMASGATKIIYEDYVAVGPKAVMLADKKTKKPNKIIFSGRSRITEGAKSIEADSIVITMNPKNFVADGNVKTVIRGIEEMGSK